MNIKIINLIILLITLTCASCEKELQNDTSYHEEKYYEFGLPKSDSSVEVYEKAYDVFEKIALKDKDALPRYNSLKSGRIFNGLFNESILDRILESSDSYKEKIEKFRVYEFIFNDFYLLYSLNSQSYKYWNEIARIGILNTYSRILAIKTVDIFLADNNTSLKDINENHEQTRLHMVKLIGKDLWGIDNKIYKFNKSDKKTTEYLKGKLDEYTKLVNSINFLEYEKTIENIDPWKNNK